MKKDSVRESVHKITSFNVAAIFKMFKSKSRNVATVLNNKLILPKTKRLVSKLSSPVTCKFPIIYTENTKTDTLANNIIESGVKFTLIGAKIKRASYNKLNGSYVSLTHKINVPNDKIKVNVNLTANMAFLYRFYVKYQNVEPAHFVTALTDTCKFTVPVKHPFTAGTHVTANSLLHTYINGNHKFTDHTAISCPVYANTDFINDKIFEVVNIETVSQRLQEHLDFDVESCTVYDGKYKLYEVKDDALNVLTLVSSVNTLLTVKFPKIITNVSIASVMFNDDTIQCKFSQPGLHELTITFDDESTFDLKIYINLYQL